MWYKAAVKWQARILDFKVKFYAASLTHPLVLLRCYVQKVTLFINIHTASMY